MAKMTEAQKLLRRRHKSYSDYTTKILDEMAEVIVGIRKFAHSEGLYDANTHTLDFIAIIEEDASEFVFLTGFFKPNMGTTITSVFGEKTKIDSEETRNNMSQMMRIGLPMDVAFSGDQQQSYDFLTAYSLSMKEAEEAAEASADTPLTGEMLDNIFDESDDVQLSDEEKKDREKLKKILDGAVNKTGLLN